MVLVLLSALVERFSVSHVWDFISSKKKMVFVLLSAHVERFSVSCLQDLCFSCLLVGIDVKAILGSIPRDPLVPSPSKL